MVNSIVIQKTAKKKTPYRTSFNGYSWLTIEVRLLVGSWARPGPVPVPYRYYISRLIVRVGRSIAITSPALTIATLNLPLITSPLSPSFTTHP